MSTQKEKAELFGALHQKGNPLILFNVWDAGSAKAVEEAGARAVATGSWSVAAANGFADGESLPIEIVLANAERIVKSVGLPVTIDFEGGYAADVEPLQRNIERVIASGAVGINFEDQIVGGDELYAIDAQARRIAAIRETAERAGIPFFINARTDVFLKNYAAHDPTHVAEAVARSRAYAAAGASGLFAPGLRNPAFIKELCESAALPVNIMVLPETPSNAELAALGVARISYGPAPYREMIESLKMSARQAFSASSA